MTEHLPPPSPLRISGPDALPVVLPHLLGFVPLRSLVVLGLEPDHDRVVVSLRVDLPDPEDEADCLSALACYADALPALERAGATDAIAVLLPGGPDDAWGDCVTEDLPLRDLALDVHHLLGLAGAHVRDVVCVVGDRVASYLCDDRLCCPIEGRAVDPEEATRVRSRLVAAGSAPLPSRETLVQALAPRDRDDRLATAVRKQKGPALLRSAQQPDRRVAAFVSDCAAWGARPSSPSVLARLVAVASLICSEIRPRDLLLRRLGVERDRDVVGAVRQVLGEAVRCADGDGAAPPAAVLAVAAWAGGDGAAARVAVERALAADPSYSLGLLVLTALDQGMPPWEWRMLMEQLSEEEILGDDPPGRERSPA